MNLIDDYVQAVDRRLYGANRVRADMLAEIRDALVDATDAHRNTGLADADAQRLAVLEFGAPGRVASGLQEVLAVAQARRTAWLLLAVLSTQYTATGYLSRSGGWGQFWDAAGPSAAYEWLAQAVDLFNVLALIAAGAGYAALRWGLRYLGLRRELVRAVSVFSVVIIAVTLLSALLLVVSAPGAGIVGALASAAWWAPPFGVVLVSALRSWRATG